MKQRYYDPATECAPINKLVLQMEDKLAKTDVFLRAARSPLYRERWQEAGVDPSAIKSYADLRTLPYTSSADLRLAQEKYHPDEFVCSTQPPRFWISTSGSTGVPKWIPIGGEDRENNREVSNRMAYFLDKQPISPEDTFFGISAPAPFISDTGTWWGFIDELCGNRPQDVNQIETVIFSYEDGIEGVSMALKRKVSVFGAFPSLVMRIADGLSENAPEISKQRLKEKITAENILAYIVTRVRKIRARDIVKVHTGMFAGEPLGPYRKALHEVWGLENSYNGYTSSEFQIAYFECSEQHGMHVWLDVSLPEIIPQAELSREREEDGYIPKSIPLWLTQPGEEGELVVTNFNQSFPLVRWRTSDLIHVISVEPCPCGRTHPRINVLERSDDLVNLGVIRFSTFVIKAVIDGITQPSAISRWQLRISRQDYKPLLTVIVNPADKVDPPDMIAVVQTALNNIETLRTGWENNLICKPVIKIDSQLGDRISSSGKFRPLIYENYSEEAI